MQCPFDTPHNGRITASFLSDSGIIFVVVVAVVLLLFLLLDRRVLSCNIPALSPKGAS